MRPEVEQLCAHWGRDPLLVQGAGGNVSWKEGDALWVKASGTWLAQAQSRDIFVPVDLPHLRAQLSSDPGALSPVVLGDVAALRPSIETSLHALMPHKVVAHLHAVEAHAHLIAPNAPDVFLSRIGAKCRWSWVPYRKPGSDLASAVSEALAAAPGTDVLLLQCHGIVVGADTPEALAARVSDLVSCLRYDVQQAQAQKPVLLAEVAYRPCDHDVLHELAQQPERLAQLPSRWAICPDHVVFLGASPVVLPSLDALNELTTSLNIQTDPPVVVFVRGEGCYVRKSLSAAGLAQLGFYADVLSRLPRDVQPICLDEAQIADLLNWDAEKHRQAMNRH